MLQIGITGIQLYQVVGPACSPAQAAKVMKIYRHKADVHNGCGIGMDNQSVNGEDSAPDGIYNTKLHHGSHQK